MKVVDFYFDPRAIAAREAFEHLPQLLQGATVLVNYHPLSGANLERKLQHDRQQEAPQNTPQEGLIAQAWASAWPGTSPSRWACEQLLHALHASGAAGGAPGDRPVLTEAARAAWARAQDQAQDALRRAGVQQLPVWLWDGRAFGGPSGLVDLADALHHAPL